MNENISKYQDILAEKTFNFDIISILQGAIGIAVLLLIAWIFSSDRKAIPWSTVGKGLFAQLIIAVSVLFFPPVQKFITFVGQLFVSVLNWTREGSEFLFGGLLDSEKFGFIFAFQILPTIIFFSALTSLLFYLGIIQRIVWVFAWLMTRAMKLSGAESLAVAGNIFLGQTESPLMIKPYIKTMTRSEIMLIMTAGMSTMAGGVLAAYIKMLGNGIPQLELEFARHLLSASVMAAPGAVVISKILVPQAGKVNEELKVPREKMGKNALDAVSNGTFEGLKLAANVAAMLLVFYALIAGVNHILRYAGKFSLLSLALFFGSIAAALFAYKKIAKVDNKKLTYSVFGIGAVAAALLIMIPFFGIGADPNTLVCDATGGRFPKLSMEFILGYVFAPVIWLLGVCAEDVPLVGRLLGQKIILTEFIGYGELAKMLPDFAQPKSAIMSTYVLCGFANFASVGIQIGGIGSLAPNQKPLLATFGMRALLGGTLAALVSATIVGMML